MDTFAGAVGRIRDAMAGPDWGALASPAARRPRPELAARRRAGRDAYQRAMEACGMPHRQATIWARAAFDDED